MTWLLIYFILCFAVGIFAFLRDKGFFSYFFLSLLISPLFGLILLLEKTKKRGGMLANNANNATTNNNPFANRNEGVKRPQLKMSGRGLLYKSTQEKTSEGD